MGVKLLKHVIVWVAVLAIVLGGILAVWGCTFRLTDTNGNCSAVIWHCVIDGKNRSVALDDNESACIARLFNGKVLWRDIPACGFRDEVSLEIDGVRYRLALDGCNLIHDDSSDLYFSLSDKEYSELLGILEKYGIGNSNGLPFGIM